MKRILLSFLSIAVIASSSMAQVVDPCGTNSAHENYLKNYPELAKESESLENIFASKPYPTAENYAKKVAPYKIPVVVHVLHMYGNENVSDSYVYAQIDQLNQDFTASNADLSQVVPAFDTLIGDAQIEFVLAAKDPFGNCTNGIEHIYTHETRSGDGSDGLSAHKVGQWDRSHYFNIWMMETLEGGAGLLGYGTFPSMVTGTQFWRDGVAVRHDNSAAERTLTHEVGHWLGLCHTFGCAGTSGDGICQGDDNCDDTPSTDGSWGCNLTEDGCNPGTVENVQNFMDYSSCLRNFTPDQVAIMTNSMEDEATAQRKTLSNDTTWQETGIKDLILPQVPSNDINNLTVPLCVPVADFYSPDRTVCQGSFALFEDHSWNAVVGSRLWEFEGGTPATSTSPNVNVSWDTYGWKKVKLTVTNEAGSDTREEQQYIYVSPQWADNTGPASYNMNNDTHLFIVENAEDNHGKFQVVNSGGSQGNAFKLGNYKDVSQADYATEDWFYNYRLGGSIDGLITPSFDLRNTSGVTVTFKYAYATNAIDPADITEKLKCYTSSNCGESWLTSKTIQTTALVTAGYAGGSDYTPSNDVQWVEESFNVVTGSGSNRMRFKFEFEASDLSSNLWIDDISINGVLSLSDDVIANMDLEVYPNPTNGQAINVTYAAQNEPTEFILRDVQGKIIAQQVINTTNAQVTQALDNTENLASSYYFLEVKTGGSSITKKVVVL